MKKLLLPAVLMLTCGIVFADHHEAEPEPFIRKDPDQIIKEEPLEPATPAQPTPEAEPEEFQRREPADVTEEPPEPVTPAEPAPEAEPEEFQRREPADITEETD